ncbi:MAG: hypothetical protein KBS76_00365 [Ruminococcus sp.]|nr:hypothetical protein [Candidatus Apopatosoma intestinale]
MKKLIPIISMLLVVVSLLGTATYAWFSMNLTVEATGMQVKAVSSGGIAIASYTKGDDGAKAPDATDFKSSAAAAYLASANVFPTSTPDATTWYTAFASETDRFEPSGGYTQVTASDLGQYVLVSKFQVKSLGTTEATSSTDLYLTNVTLGGLTSKPLNNALRIAIVYAGEGAQGTHFIAPVRSGSIDSLKCVSGTSLVNYPEIEISPTNYFMSSTSYSSGDNVIYLGKATNTAKDLTVYIYFEGEDVSCYSLNAIEVDTITVNLTFSTPNPSATSN